MALTDSPPETDAPAAERAVVGPDPSALGSGDHKTVGRLYIGSGALFLVVGLVLGVVANIERIDLGGYAVVEDGDMFAQLWDLSRLMVMFGGVVPIIVGLLIAVVPLQVGATTLAFPRGAAASYWTWMVGTSVALLSVILNGGPGGGQTDFTVLWVLAFGTMLAATCWALGCVGATVLGLRASGMTLDRVPFTSWSALMFSFLGLLALPVAMAELVLAYLQVRYGFLPLGERQGLVGVMDSLTRSPSIGWIGLPILGIALDAIETHTEEPIKQRTIVLGAIGAMALFSFGGAVLAFSSFGRSIADDNALLVIDSAAVKLPPLVILGLGALSLKNGRFAFRTPLIAGVLAGGLMVKSLLIAALALLEPVIAFAADVLGQDWTVASWLQLGDSTLSEGVRALAMAAAVLAAIAGVHHWGHKLFGRALDDRLGILSALAAAGGGVLWGAAELIGSLIDPEIGILSGPTDDGVAALGVLGAAGAGLLAAGGLLLLLNTLGTALGGRGSAAEPWRGLTLEWATASPPPVGNFTEAPIVTSAQPLAQEA